MNQRRNLSRTVYSRTCACRCSRARSRCLLHRSDACRCSYNLPEVSRSTTGRVFWRSRRIVAVEEGYSRACAQQEGLLFELRAQRALHPQPVQSPPRMNQKGAISAIELHSCVQCPRNDGLLGARRQVLRRHSASRSSLPVFLQYMLLKRARRAAQHSADATAGNVADGRRGQEAAPRRRSHDANAVLALRLQQ
jgi:hypothetical protein